MLLKKWENNEIKKEISKYLKTEENENENTILQKSMGCNKSSFKKEVHSDTYLP